MNQVISTRFESGKDRPYTGVELRPHFLLTELGLRGSALGAFIGSCRVETGEMVDWEDRLANDRIEASRMVHFIGEFFGISLREGVLMQRLFMALAEESLNDRLLLAGSPHRIVRKGDDLYLCPAGGLSELIPAKQNVDGASRKLSVSIVTASPVSQLLHVGINVDPAGAPVSTIGLAELGVDPADWVPRILEAFSAELAGVEWACAKVRPVV